MFLACLHLALLLGSAKPATAQSPEADVIRGELMAGNFVAAERHARDLLLATERLHGNDAPEVAPVLDLLAEALRRGGKTGDPEALRVCLRSLELKERSLPPDDPSIAVSLENLGALRIATGELAAAKSPLESALRIRIRAYGPWHADVARSLLFLGNLEFTSAREDSARPFVLQAVAIQDSILPPEDPARASALNLLAGIHYARGEYREAGVVYERVLALQTRTLGLGNPATASTLQNLGALSSEMGDLVEARYYLEQARAAMKRALPPGHPMMARTLVNLGGVREKSGDILGALSLFREALQIQKAALGESHSDVAWTLMRIGRLQLSRGRAAEAKTALQEALGVQERQLGPNHPDLAWTLSSLARVDARSGGVHLAVERAERARAIQEKTLGVAHPDIAPTLADLASFHALAGDTSEAIELALRSSRLRAEHLLLTAGGLSERQALAYAAAGPTGLDVALTLIAYPGALGTPASVRRVWDAVLQTRTLVLDETAARHRATLEDTLSAEAATAGETLRGARQRLANLLVRGPAGDPAERYQALVRRARLETERAERDLGHRSDEFRRELQRARPGLSEVFAATPRGWGIVAYTTFVTEGKRSYVAFVRGVTGEPAAVSIGDANRVDGLVRRWAADVLSDPSDRGPAAARAEAAARRSGRALRAQVWDPVRGVMAGAVGVLIVPDGALHGVSFGALPGGGSRYLAEDSLIFHYVSSELDVAAKRTEGAHGRGLLAVGGVEFGAIPSPKARTSTTGAAGITTAGTATAATLPGSEGCEGFYRSSFPALPHSRLEVEEIARSWSESTPAVILTGAEATEAAFKRLAPGKRVLHLATHGFFLDPDRCLKPEAGTRGIGGYGTPVRPKPRPAFDQQSLLLLSGVALAAANRRSGATPHEEDGILTAEEVASLDLRGVEWAVLSACDTGAASAASGQGVLGLRRAFQTAGVATLVISLWPVQDQAAREWMRALYQSRFHAGIGTASSIRAAMLEVLRSRRAQGRSTNPSFWAAFLAAGDWN